MKKTEAFLYGMSLSGIHPDTVNMASEFNKTASIGGVLQKRAALLAAAMFDAAGKAGSPEHIIFSKIAGSEWDVGYEVFTEPVMEVLGRLEFAKQATLNPATLFKGGLLWGPKLLTSMFLVSAALGAGGGALYNAGKRGISVDSLKADAKETRIQHYQKLTGEIEREMKRRGVSPQEATNTVMKSYT